MLREYFCTEEDKTFNFVDWYNYLCIGDNKYKNFIRKNYAVDPDQLYNIT